MCSTTALGESLAACIRSSFTPMVAYQPASSTSGVSAPGVWNWGAGMLRPLIRSKRNAAYMGLSMPVTQTSPSPWAAWASPQEKSAPACCTGRYRTEPFVMWRVSMLPPNGPGGMTTGFSGPDGLTPIVPKKGSIGIAMSSLNSVVTVDEVEDFEVGVGKVLGQKPEAGEDR